ncbi:MAG: hypothetical protein BGO31_13975 [Bacteroidetes bacterium 43-16]|nr:MAG: hypothetical protein BGO31_13975 [Bacteroidetes bacterium 43-16]
MDIAPSTYSNIERGITDINISRLMQLAEYFSVHYSQILSVDNTNVFYFSTQSQENSTQHNVNHQGNNSYSEIYEATIELAKEEINFLKEQNTKLLEIIASK